MSGHESVMRRLQQAELVAPGAILAASDTDLRACGLSRQKAAYARALAGAGLDFAALSILPDAEVIVRLVEIKGIGRWTAEIYTMFALGRADVLCSGDLALQEAARLLFGLPARPTDKALREMAAAWSPWRGVAARLLWAYYRVAKNRDGIR